LVYHSPSTLHLFFTLDLPPLIGAGRASLRCYPLVGQSSLSQPLPKKKKKNCSRNSFVRRLLIFRILPSSVANTITRCNCQGYVKFTGVVIFELLRMGLNQETGIPGPVTEVQGYGDGMPGQFKFSKCTVRNCDGRQSYRTFNRKKMYERFHM
jgi:hypothetical protein